MPDVHLNLLFTLLASLAVVSLGQLLVRRTGFLQRMSIPAPVVGGVLIAVVLAFADAFLQVRVSFDLGLRDNLLLAFFATAGLSADASTLRRAGRRLLIFLAVSTGFVVVQNLVGVAAALALDLHPVVGLLGGSVTLTGDHHSGAIYGARFADTMNIAGAVQLAVACATAGLVLGSVLGGPLAEYLIKKHKLTGVVPPADRPAAERPDDDPITTQSAIYALCAILVCVACGRLVARLAAGTESILPEFLACLVLGVVLRNLASVFKALRPSPATVDVIGSVAISLFLVMALIGLRLVDLTSLAGPLVLILTIQAIVMALYAVFVTFRVMGRDYDAAVLAAGHVGFGLSSTGAALAVMKTVTQRRGPSPMAFLIVSMVGAFLIDIANAFVIQGYLALPIFGFPL